MSNKQNANDGNEEKEVEGGQPQEIPKNVTKNNRGNIRKYNFLKTVKSFKELDKLRFKVWP
jgi:hypothetical protein